MLLPQQKASARFLDLDALRTGEWLTTVQRVLQLGQQLHSWLPLRKATVRVGAWLDS